MRKKWAQKKEEQEKKIKRNNQTQMDSIQKVRSITLWIFIVPFVAINACLILITQFHGLFHPENIIHNTLPYIDGGASISRTARVFSYLFNFQACYVPYFIFINKILDL